MKSLAQQFEFATGITTGADHLDQRVFAGDVMVQGCQDGLFVPSSFQGTVLNDPTTGELHSFPFVGVVCDGVSGQEHSGIGANWLATRASRVILAQYSKAKYDNVTPSNPIFWERLKETLAKDIFEQAALMAGCEGLIDWAQVRRIKREDYGVFAPEGALQGYVWLDVAAAVERYFMSTLVCLVVDEKECVIAHIGDGFYSVNGQVTPLVSHLPNMPENFPYTLAYEVLGTQGDVPFMIHYVGRTDELESVLIASDGLRYLPELSPSAKKRSAQSPKPLTQVSEIFSQYWISGYGALDSLLRTQNDPRFKAVGRPLKTGGTFPTLEHEAQTIRDDLAIVALLRQNEAVETIQVDDQDEASLKATTS